MRIPYVIDNQSFRLADILSGLLHDHRAQSLDIATAYFTVGGFGLVRDGLSGLGNLRLLLGQEPATGEQVGLRRPMPELSNGSSAMMSTRCPLTSRRFDWSRT